jgi:hypothetical protein
MTICPHRGRAGRTPYKGDPVRKLRTAAALAVAGMVAMSGLAVAAPAAAATGTISVKRTDGTPPDWSVTNPKDGDCYIPTNAGYETFDVVNGTNRVIWIYGSPGCSSDPDTDIAPGGHLGPYFGVISIRVMTYS